MKKLYPAAACLIFAALSLSACGGAAPAADASPETTSASPSPSPTPTATTAQFASILSEQEKTWRNYDDNIGPCAFASITDSMDALTCKFTVQTVTLTARTAAKNFRALPTPPTEIATLRTRTLSALDALAAIDATTACKDTKSKACNDAETLVNGAIRPLISVLDAWRPYMK